MCNQAKGIPHFTTAVPFFTFSQFHYILKNKQIAIIRIESFSSDRIVSKDFG